MVTHQALGRFASEIELYKLPKNSPISSVFLELPRTLNTLRKTTKIKQKVLALSHSLKKIPA